MSRKKKTTTEKRMPPATVTVTLRTEFALTLLNYCRACDPMGLHERRNVEDLRMQIHAELNRKQEPEQKP